MVGANPTPIAWGETPSAIKQGVADALDPSVGALLTFGFKDILSHVTFTQAVPDAQVYSCNMEWFKSLPAKVQDGVMFGSEISTQQNLAKVPGARNYAMAELTKAGVEFHSLSDAQLGNGRKLAVIRDLNGIPSRLNLLVRWTFSMNSKMQLILVVDTTSTMPNLSN